jgi:hypothetical protein
MGPRINGHAAEHFAGGIAQPVGGVGMAKLVKAEGKNQDSELHDGIKDLSFIHFSSRPQRNKTTAETAGKDRWTPIENRMIRQGPSLISVHRLLSAVEFYEFVADTGLKNRITLSNLWGYFNH